MYTRICTALVLLPLLGLVAGCVQRVQDVRPQLTQAKEAFERAKEMELAALEEDERRQARIASTFDQLEAATLESLRVMLRSGWKSDLNDFSSTGRDVAWRAWFGVGQQEPLNAADIAAERIRLSTILSYSFSYKYKKDAQTEESTSQNGYTAFVSFGGRFEQMPHKPVEADLTRLNQEYRDWLAMLENTMRQAPVFRKVKAGRDAVEQSNAAEIARRRARIETSYNSLINMTELARDQAGALTDNAGFIALANSLTSTANRLLGKATKSHSESQSDSKSKDKDTETDK